MPLTKDQVSRLLTPVRSDRIEKKQGLSYVPQHEVRAELTRTFGPTNWDSVIHDIALVYETSYEKNSKTYWLVCYRAACTLRVRDFEGNHLAEFTEYHCEENAPQPNRGEAHALALTSVSSYALRRAAIGLGDNMGLHLYAGGSVAPLIQGTLMSKHFWPKEAAATANTEQVSEEKAAMLAKSLGAKEVKDGE